MPRARHDKPTARERQVLALYMQNMSHKTIATMLHIKPKTVDTTLTDCQDRLCLDSREQLRAYALFHGYNQVQEVGA